MINIHIINNRYKSACKKVKKNSAHYSKCGSVLISILTFLFLSYVLKGLPALTDVGSTFVEGVSINLYLILLCIFLCKVKLIPSSVTL